MKKLLLFGVGLVFTLVCCQKIKPVTNVESTNNLKEISFFTEDSILIFGDLYEQDKNGSSILLFHQGGSNSRGEYNPIIPKLIKKGYNILAIDQRVGGQIYGNYNRTIANIPTISFGDEYTYCDAYSNLESALDYMIESGFSGDKILWGSSYSASLAIQLANNRQEDVKGVLAFSPASGGHMQECRPEKYFETLKIPLLILRPPNEMESENSKAQFELATKNNHQVYAAEHGVHGSSMLVEVRVRSEVSENWKVVMKFLDGLTK